MKFLGKAATVAIAIVALAMFVFGFFGYNTRYGDITTVVVRGADDMTGGMDYSDSISADLKASGEDVELTSEQLEQAKRAITERLAFFNVPDFSVRINEADKSMNVSFPFISEYQSLLSYIGKTGTFEARDAQSDAVLFDASGIKSVKPDYNSTDGVNVTVTGLTLSFTPEAQAIYAENTERLAAEKAASNTDQIIEFYYNDTLVAQKNVTQKVDASQDVVSTAGVQTTTAEEMSLVLNSSALPCELSTASIARVTPQLGVGILDTLWITAVILMAAAAVYLVFVYKLAGVSALLMLIGTAGGVMAIISGFAGGSSVAFTAGTLAAFVLVMLVSFDVVLRDLSSVKTRFSESSALTPVKSALSDYLGIETGSYITLAAFCAFFILFNRGYGGVADTVASIYASLNVSVSTATLLGNFGTASLWGLLISYAFCVVGNRLLLNFLSGSFGAKSASFYGGKVNE